jgi:Secretion system C-terminal sorting domain
MVKIAFKEDHNQTLQFCRNTFILDAIIPLLERAPMINKLLQCLFFFIVSTATGISQTWIDSVRTLYSSSLRLHHPTFRKIISSDYYFQNSALISIAEDSGTVSNIKTASLDPYGSVVPSFQTIITRPSSIGKIQFIEISDSPGHQYLFWEEGIGSGQRIMYSRYQMDSTWGAPQYFAPSSYRQQELISTQTNISSYPSPYSFAIGWNENDSLTIINLTSDSIRSKIRIATNAPTDSVHPAISDGMIAWETHNSASMLRYAAFNAFGSIISSDTIPYSQNASCPIFLSLVPWISSPSLCWMKTENEIGNIIGTRYNLYSSPFWEPPSIITNDSSGMNVPIAACISPAVVKSARLTYFSFDYLVFIRTLNDSNAFVRNTHSSYNYQREFWTSKTIEGIDVQPGGLVQSAWIEKDSNSYSIQYHTGYAFSGAVKDNPLLPSTITLEQNYPNPFNPSTAIQYYLPIKGLVTLEIFDILGRKISTLVNEKQFSGPHQVEWSAQSIASGIYFYRLTCNTMTSTKKMLFIR